MSRVFVFIHWNKNYLISKIKQTINELLSKTLDYKEIIQNKNENLQKNCKKYDIEKKNE